jgi:hypothetical protein
MNDDELRNLLRVIDPVGSSLPNEVADSAAAQRLLEEIMQTSTETPVAHEPPRRLRRRAWPLAGMAAAAAAVVAIAVGIVVTGDEKDQQVAASLALPNSGAISSCLAFDVDFLAQMPTAFKATATSVTDTEVVLAVDHWYKSQGDQADVVTLQVAAGNTSATLDGITFVQGETYLVTATEGVVNGCGFSGLATPELEAAFESAFPA